MSNSQLFMGVQFLPTFIEAYRSHPCLWRVQSKEYSNKKLKDAAYQELVNVTKEVVPDCSVDFVKRKIDILRGSYRREAKKVQASKKSGTQSVYEPKLWYYKLLLFLADQEEIRPSISSVDKDDDTVYDVEGDVLITESDESLTSTTDKACVEYSELPTTNNAENYTRNRKRLRGESKADQRSTYLEKAVSIDDECDTFGKHVSAQLRNMDYMQSIYCQNVINQVLFQGKLMRMKENTTVIHHQPNSTNASGSV